MDGANFPINWFGIHNRVAFLHTHGAYNPGCENDKFSYRDKDYAHNNGMLPTYVATPIGKLLKYVPKTQKEYTLPDNIPFDPNHPLR